MPGVACVAIAEALICGACVRDAHKVFTDLSTKQRAREFPSPRNGVQ